MSCLCFGAANENFLEEGEGMLRSRISRCAPVRFWMVLAAVLLLCAGLSAQTTISTGSIQGTVSDASGAVLSGAKVTIPIALQRKTSRPQRTILAPIHQARS